MEILHVNCYEFFLTTSVHSALFLDFYAHTRQWQSSQPNDGGRFPVEVEVEFNK